MKKNMLALSLFILGPAAPLSAEIMTYQGRLKESNIPVNASRSFAFELCADETPTGCVASPDGAKPFQVQNGLFKSTFTLPAVDLSAGPWYLRVKVEGVYLSPVERLTFVPYSVFASSAAYSAAAVQKTGDVMTGQLTLSGSSFTVTGAQGLWSAAAAFAGNVVISSASAAAYGGIAVSTHVYLPAGAKFYGDGSGITGVTGASGTDSTKVLKAGDTMTGQLTNTSSVTVTGNGGMYGLEVSSNVSLGGLLYSANGNFGIGTADPGVKTVIQTSKNKDGLRIAGANSGIAPLLQFYNGPAFTFTFDSGTLNLRPGFSLDTPALSILNGSGNIGIGETAPAYRLQVSSAAGYAGTLLAVSTGATNVFSVDGYGVTALKFTGDGSGLTGVTGATGTDPNALPLSGGTLAGQLTLAGSTLTVAGGAFSVGGSTLVVVNGNVGIGTATPGALLHVMSASAPKAQFSNSDWTSSVGTSLGVLSGAASGNTYMRIQAYNGGVNSGGNLVLNDYGGNVGIGTTSPGAALDVAGSGNFAGSVTALSSGTFRAAGGNQFSIETSSGILVQAGRIQAPAIQLTNGAAANYVLSSDAAGYAKWVDPGAGGLGDPFVGNEISDVVDNTLTRSGLGTVVSPYKVTLNLASNNNWTGVQSFNSAIIGNLTGAASDNVLKAGDIMTGQLTLAGSSLTVTGSEFSVGGSTLVVKNGWLGLGTNAPAARLHVVSNNGYVHFASPSSAFILNMVPQNYSGAYLNNNASGPIALSIDNDAKVFATRETLVGIGTAIPSYRLHVSSGAGETGVIMAVSTGATNVFSVSGSGVTALKFTGDGSGLTGLGTGGLAGVVTIANGGTGGTTSAEARANLGAVAVTGDSMTGQLTNTSSVTITGNGGGAYGLQVSSNVSLAGTMYTANGNVGIGSANPVYKLDVTGDILTTGFLRLSSLNPAFYYLGLNSGVVQLAAAGSSAVSIVDTTSGIPTLYAKFSNRQVGIGTTAPDQRLTVAGNISQTGVLISSGTGNNYFAGNVGISTGAPQARLDVLAGGSALTDMAQIWRNSGGTIISSVSATGVVTAAKFVGDGSGITGLASADNVTGTVAIANGGTNSSAALVGSAIMVSNGTSIVQGPSGNATSVLHGNVSGIPTYSQVALAADVTGTLGLVNGGTGGTTSAEARANLGAVAVTGDTMTGQLTVGNNSTMTVTGNAFSVAGSTLVVKAGRVGIGTQSPAYQLDVMETIRTGSLPGSNGRILLGDGDLAHGMTSLVPTTDTFGLITANSAAGGLHVSGYSGGAALPGLHLGGVIGSADPSDAVAAVQIDGARQNAASSQPLGVAETILGVRNNGGPNLLTVLGSGKVGISTGAPDQLLTVAGNISQTGVLISSGAGNNYFAGSVGFGTANPFTQVELAGTTAGFTQTRASGANQDAPDYLFRKARGSVAVPALVASGDYLGSISFNGYDGAAYQLGASIRALVDGTPAAGDMPGRLQFFTTPDGSATEQERMRITNAGNVGIGVTSPLSKLEVSGGSVTIHGQGTDVTVLQAGDNGIVISTGGAIQSTGVGHGSVAGNARGRKAVDLQVSRSAATQVASGDSSVLSGGDANSATGPYAVVSGGQVNVAGATYSSVSGGGANKATGYASAVHGGQGNLASASWASVSGNANTGSGNYSTVSGGSNNTALGQYSWAAGNSSSSTANGAFTWSDSQGTEVRNTTADRTVFKNKGGFLITSQTGVLPGNDAMLEVRSSGSASGFYAQIWRDSTGLVVASMTATGRLSGDGSGLTGVSAADATKLPLTGGSMDGQLTLANSTLTVTGNAFSVGVSTLVVKAGRVGIGQISPIAALEVRGQDATNSNYSLVAGDSLGNNFLTVRNDGNIGLAGGPTGNTVTIHGNTYYNTSGAALAIANVGGTVNYGHIGVLSSDVWGFSSGNSGITMSAPALAWNAAGAAGVGTSTPDQKLTVAGNISQTGMIISSGTGRNYFAGEVTAPRYQVGGSTVLAVLPGIGSLGIGVDAGIANFGDGNLFVGTGAGKFTGGGASNSFFGTEAGYSNDTGLGNSFVGYYAGRSSVWSGNNTYMGSQAGFSGDGDQNSFFGADSGYSNTAGDNNVYLGYKAGYAAAGSNNIVIGSNKDTSQPIANDELNIGGLLYGNLSAKTIGISTRAPAAALDIVSTGTASNVYAQIWRNSTGLVVASMTATGRLSGDGSGLTGLGDNLGNHTGTQVLQMGAYGINTSSNIAAAFYQINGSTVLAVVGGTAIAVGPFAGSKNTAANNTYVGYGAGRDNISGNSNVFVGDWAGVVTTAGQNTFVGSNAGITNVGGSANTFVGQQAGYNNLGGTQNSFFGALAGSSNSGGGSNSYFGYNAGNAGTSAAGNSFFGTNAGDSTTTGSSNVFLGASSADSNTTGRENVYIGHSVARYNQAGSAGVVIGYQAGGAGAGAPNSFSSSTLVGYQAGYNLLAGSADNTFLGWQAGYNVLTGTGNIVIGHNKLTSAPGANNELNIGGVLFGNLSSGYIGLGAGVTNPAGALQVGQNGLIISTGGAVQTTGLGHGTVSGNPRGVGAVDLQTARSAASQVASAAYSVVGGGYGNMASVSYAFAGGGNNNSASGGYSVVGGGLSNQSSNGWTTVSGGSGNIASQNNATVGGGSANTAAGYSATVAGGASNNVLSSAFAGFIGGGENNISTGAYSTVGGGRTNTSSGAYSAVLGGQGNLADGAYAAVGGGRGNNAAWNFSAVTGGENNRAWREWAFVAGGTGNTADGQSSGIIGGDANKTSGFGAFIGGGAYNQAKGWGAVAFGASNASMGDYTFAAGKAATSAVNGTFTWADSSSEGAVNSVLNQVMFKAKGGFWVSTGTVYANPAFYVDAGNNIGIGTVSPTAKLHLAEGGIRFPDGTLQTTAGVGSANSVSNTVDVIINGDSDGNMSGSVRLQTAAIDRVYVSTGGNVGIGTSIPGALLDVNGTARLARNVVEPRDSGGTMTVNDYGKTITVNSASPQAISLPAGGAASIGAQFTFVKLGAGKVTINAGATDYIADSSMAGGIYNNAVSPAYATITLRLVTSNQWMLVGGEGSWITQ